MLFSPQTFTRDIKKQKVALSISHHKEILKKHLNACFLWALEYKRKRLVNTSDAYVFCNSYLKYSFENFLSIFSLYQCLYIVRFEWDIVFSNSYDGWDKRGCTMKRYSVNVYVHISPDTSLPLYAFWMTPILPSVA